MSEIIRSEIPEVREKIPTSEYRQISPGIILLRKIENDRELEEIWHDEYLKAYIKANDLRSKGEHDKAILGYREAQSVVYYMKERGLASDAVILREAACHYMIIQCYNNLHEDPENVMREFHNFSLVLLDMFEMIVQNDSRARLYLENLIHLLKNNNHVDPIEIFVKLNDFYQEILNEENNQHVVGWIWKLAYFITRYSSIAHDFYMKCTPHINLGKDYAKLTQEAGKLAEDALLKLPQEYFDKDSTGINKIYSKLTKNWTGIYYDVLSAEASNIFGDYSNKLFQFTDYLWNIIVSYRGDDNPINVDKNHENSNIFPEDYEHAIELLALNYFTAACASSSNWDNSIKNLNKLYSIARKSENCERVSIIIQIYIARAALRYNDSKEDLAFSAYKEVQDLRNNETAKEFKNNSSHIFDVWLKVIKSEILLRQYDQSLEGTAVLNVETISSDISNRLNDLIKEEKTNSDYDLKQRLKIMFSIEELFKSYISKDSKIERSKVAFLPLEAKIYFILGKTNLEKAKILAKKHFEENNDKKDDEYGQKLLKMFYDSRKYLCESYSILQNMGYKDSEMLNSISDTYTNLIDFNYEISGLSENERFDKVPTRNEMPDIIKHYQLQKWIDILYESIRSERLSYKSDYIKTLSSTLYEGIKRFLPTLLQLHIIRKEDEDWGFDNSLSYRKQKMYKNAINKSDSENISQHYFYNEKEGKILSVVPFNRNEKYKLVLELSYNLTKCDEDLISDVVHGAEILLNIFDKRKKLEEATNDMDVLGLKRDLLEEVFSLFEYLLRKHKNTVHHSKEMFEIAKRKRLSEGSINNISNNNKKNKDNNNFFESDNDLQIEFAYKLHDFGKVGLDPKLILDKATRLLPYEIKHTNGHAILGAELLRSLIGLKHFKYLIAISCAHHVKYGVDKGYPFVLPGNSIKYILSKMADKFQNLSLEEHELLKDNENELPKEIINEARDINIIDQVQALRDPGRAYRRVMPLDTLNGYLISKSGRDFDPVRVEKFIKQIKKGVFDDILAHDEKEINKLHSFNLLDNYNWNELYDFLVAEREKFEKYGEIDLKVFMDYMKKGKNLGIKMSSSCFISGICEMHKLKENKKAAELEKGKKDLKKETNKSKENKMRDRGINEFIEKKDFYYSRLSEFAQTNNAQ